jgi:hypothetical protein
MKKYNLSWIFIALLISSCSANPKINSPASTPYPTYTFYPTYTPYPSPTNHPSDLPTSEHFYYVPSFLLANGFVRNDENLGNGMGAISYTNNKQLITISFIYYYSSSFDINTNIHGGESIKIHAEQPNGSDSDTQTNLLGQVFNVVFGKSLEAWLLNTRGSSYSEPLTYGGYIVNYSTYVNYDKATTVNVEIWIIQGITS